MKKEENPKNIEEIKKQAENNIKKLIENQQDLPADIAKAVDEHLWELI